MLLPCVIALQHFQRSIGHFVHEAGDYGIYVTLHLFCCLPAVQKLLGVLVRQTCISIAVSNPYLNLAEPLG